MRPLTVEIIAYAPTTFYHCQHCEIIWQQTGTGRTARAEQLANNLPTELIQDYQTLSDWIIALLNKHRGQLRVQVIDAASLEGFVKSLWYGVRRYPAVIIAGGPRIAPATLAEAEAAINLQLAARTSAA